MATDSLTESRDERQVWRTAPRDVSPRRKWWILGLIGGGLLLLVVSAVILLPALTSARNSGPQLTHTIARGDLLVTVIEQGTLESSENTEIKCKVRGENTVLWVVESGVHVEVGDELIRLDTLFIEEQIAERTKYALWSRSGAERSKADVAAGTLAVGEYKEGRFVSELMTMQMNLAVAESNLRSSQNMLNHAKMMAESGYVSELEVDERGFAVERAKLNVKVAETQIDVLSEFTKAEELARLEGNLKAITATHAANAERAEADASRRDRALEELGYCVVKAERSGMVIHPNAARWKNAPEIEEGGTVHKDQILLLMPDLTKMQIKVGVHESIVDRIEEGLIARVALPDKTIEGKISSVASITQPAGWWTGNVVKYDTIVALPNLPGLKPGMSAEVEIIIAHHKDVLTAPVAAVIETEEGVFCWVKDAAGDIGKRQLILGDGNDVFLEVKDGLKEGDEVVLNPLAYIEEAQEAALKQSDDSESLKARVKGEEKAAKEQ